MEGQHPKPANLKRFYLHYPTGHLAYIVVADADKRPFDFSDDRFKRASELACLGDACLYATGRPEERAEYGYSYTVEFDLARLLAATDPDRRPADGSVVSIHWLVQVGDEPDVEVDKRHDGCRLRIIGGAFE